MSGSIHDAFFDEKMNRHIKSPLNVNKTVGMHFLIFFRLMNVAAHRKVCPEFKMGKGKKRYTYQRKRC
ncbi:hypothetical protein AS888_04135 [Peribacillus simplex]|uniref:Uncharacterized protein n=1 Tax=Peribacillus simplex TaxID=1478 RepID=A0A120GQR3_9BACI|nr:hypothetical protein AS888_04135 [Peribacillus simplex]